MKRKHIKPELKLVSDKDKIWGWILGVMILAIIGFATLIYLAICR